MPFLNRIRLPFYLTHAQFPDERNVFRLADGSSKVQSVVVRKVYEGKTNYLPEIWHQRLKIALSHDIVNIEGERYFGNVVAEGDYEIGWVDFMDYPVAPALFKVQVSPFNATNSNCQTCEEALQLELVDDTFDHDVQENTDDTISVFDNDTILCFPFLTSISWWSTALLTESPVIDDLGIVTLHTKTVLPTSPGAHLFTYRVTCPSGSYDEADVFAPLDGSAPVCLDVSALHLVTPATDNSVDVGWTEPSPPPSLGYGWQLYKASNLGLAVQEGLLNAGDSHVSISTLEPCIDYSFFIRSLCLGSINSGYQQIDFMTECADSCGKYEIEFNDGTGIRTHFGDITYMGCDSLVKVIRVNNMTTRIICMLQDSAGVPVEIIRATTVTYIEPCS